MRLLLLAILLAGCGVEGPDLATDDSPVCWYEDGDPTLHRYYPESYVHDEEFERGCEQLGKPKEYEE